MSSLLIAACRIQAAVKAYCSVREHTDWELWKAQFDDEMKKSFDLFRKTSAREEAPRVHPLLLALSIVLANNEDFSRVTEIHPLLHKHKYYNPSAVFPELSPFLPPREDRWWEDLVALSPPGQTQEPVAPEKPAARQQPAAPEEPAVPEEPAPSRRLGRLKIKILPPKPQNQPVDDEDAAMTVDDSETAKASRRSRKRKAVDAASPPGSSKRSAPASQPQAQAAQGSGANELTPWTPPFFVKFECDKCVKRGVECKPEPTGSCQRCRDGKLGCSLMPRNATGKTNRQSLGAQFVFEYRLRQLNKSKPEVDQKGKKPARKPEDESQPEASGSGLSPSTSLMHLQNLTLESGSSKGDSPVLEHGSEKSSHASLPALFSVEVLLPSAYPTPRVLVPPFRQRRQPSPPALSRSSDDSQNLIARVSALEARMDSLEEWRKEDARWRKRVNRKLENM